MTAPWTAFGPAEFDRRRMPKGRKPQPAQAGLFVLAAEPLPAKPAPVPEELPGQAALFGEDGDGEELPDIVASFTVPPEGRACSGCREDIPAGATAGEDSDGWAWCARCSRRD